LDFGVINGETGMQGFTKTRAMWALMGLVAGIGGLSGASDRTFQDEVVYFVMTDRFENGDASNDTGDFAPALHRTIHGYDPTDPEFYHGGDITGLRERLDYIEGLGATAIWVTPVMKNKPYQYPTAGYHGYWMTDFLNVDPHLGTNQEFKGFVEDAHARGMRVILDIVINHTADVIYFEEGQYSYRTKAAYPYRDANGRVFDDADFAADGINNPAFPLLSTNTTFPYTPVVTSAEANVKNPAWLNDRRYYHNRGNSSFSGENSVYGDFYGLDDLFTEHPDVLDGMVDVFSHWIREYRVDGFRVDTVKHVNLGFWKTFGERIRAVAKDEGIDHFFLFGEVYDADVPFVSAFTTTGSLDANLDFGLAFHLRDFISRQIAPDGLKGHLGQDDQHTDGDSSALAQPVFLGNHDMGRWAGFLRQDNPTLSDQPLISLWKTGYALLFFMRGQPVIYYGDEQGFFGAGGYSAAREDMMPSRTPAYMTANLVGTYATPAASNFDTAHPMYLALAQMAQLYHAERTLRRGAFRLLDVTAPMTIAFKRYDVDSGEEFLVVANANRQDTVQVQLPVMAGNEGSPYAVVYNSETAPQGSYPANTGSVTLSVGPQRVIVLKAMNPTRGTGTTLGSLQFSTLTDGSSLNGRTRSRDGQTYPLRPVVELAIACDRDPSVTLELVASNGERIGLGTDRSPPYRFYPDLSSFAPGTRFSLEATARVADASQTVAVHDLQWNPEDLAEHVVVHFRPGSSGIDGWRLEAEGAGLAGGSPQQADFIIQTEFGWAAYVSPADMTQPLQIQISKGAGQTVGVDRQFHGSHTIIPSQTPHVFSIEGHPQLYFREAEALGEFRITLSGVAAAQIQMQLRFGDGTLSGWTTPAGSSGDEWRFVIPASRAGGHAYWNAPCAIEVRVDGDLLPVARSFVPSVSAYWRVDTGADGGVFRSPLEPANTMRIHYHRPDGDYGNYQSGNYADYWGLDVWQGAATDTSWEQPLKPAGTDFFGVYFDVPLADAAYLLAYVLHRGETKDPGNNQFVRFSDSGYEVWQVSGAATSKPYVLDTAPSRPVGYPLSLEDVRSKPVELLPAPGGLNLSIQTVPGRLYLLQSSPDLLNWTPAGTPFEGDGAVHSFQLESTKPANWLRFTIR
jgi:glycosidase